MREIVNPFRSTRESLPTARRGDPVTSHMAAKDAIPAHKKHKELAFFYFAVYGPATTDDFRYFIETVCNIPAAQWESYRRRVSDLKSDELIEVDGVGKTRSGSKAEKYRLTSYGRERATRLGYLR